MRYLEQGKAITNSWAKGAKGLSGATSFSYDVNGNLAVLDRGRKTGASANTVAYFEYDLEGQIIGRADKASALTSAEFFEGYAVDPNAAPVYDGYGSRWSWLIRQQQLRLGGAASASTELQSYLYANNKPLAEARGTQQVVAANISISVGVEEGQWLFAQAVEVSRTRKLAVYRVDVSRVGDGAHIASLSGTVYRSDKTVVVPEQGMSAPTAAPF